jgi:cyclic-di-GMP-binding biofilm dispersal mediator protein
LLLDLSSQDSIDTLVNYLNSAVELAGVVVAAGRVAFGPAATMPKEAVEELNQTNYLAPMDILNRLQPNLARQDEAFVLNVSGVVASTPMPQMAHYSASKAAIHGFLMGVTREWRRDGIKVFSSLLGHTETGLATRPISGESPKLPQGLSPVEAVKQMLEEALA